jgi:transposase
MAELKEFAGIKDRLLAVLYSKKRFSNATICALINRSKSFVYKWAARYRRLGLQGLFDLKRSGRPSKLNTAETAQLRQRIADGPKPDDEISVFDGPSIQVIIVKELNVTYANSSIYGVLHRIGFRRVRPRPIHEKNSQAVMDLWEKDSMPACISEVKEKHPEKALELWFQDEMRFGEKTELAPIWALKGQNIRQCKQLGFRNMYIYGAINPVSGKHVGLIYPKCHTDIMNEHLRLVSQGIQANAHAILVMDQASWHAKSKDLQVPLNITILSLPPYSPELNPVERLWKSLKAKYLKNRLILKSEDLVQIECDVWNKVTESQIKSLCKTRLQKFANFS